MFWKLQENVINESDLNLLVSFIQGAERFTQSSKVKEFETAFAQWQGCKYCVFVNSGSSANLLLVSALKELHGWEMGDEIIVPAVTWPTTVTPIIQLGLKPVFVDVNLTDLSLDCGQVEKKISPRTRGIFIVHLLGFPADVEKIRRVVGGRDIALFEDCCESQGAALQGVKVGNLGCAGTFSFYWGHHMTTVEGGMICTDDEDLFNLLVIKRSHGLARELPPEHHADLMKKYADIDFNFLFLSDGFNLRNTEFSAVLGLAQLSRMDAIISIRNRNYAGFVEICKEFPNELMVIDVDGVSSFVFPFLFRRDNQRQAFQELIRSAGIESRPLVSGNLLHQPFLRHFYDPDNFPNADFLHFNAMYIGNNQFVNDERLNFLNELMTRYFSTHR